MLRIMSWNVNGIRASLKNGLEASLKELDPDIIGFQEIKAAREQVENDYPDFANSVHYHSIWNPSFRKGYSGTMLMSKIKPSAVEKGFGISEFDDEGRIIISHYRDVPAPFTIFNIYYPNGQMDSDRLAYKLRFYDCFLDYADNLKKSGKNLIIMGDFNTAHREIDLKNPEENKDRSGFLPIEREWMDKFISHGYIDTFRTMNPGAATYSWWTYRFNARMKNIGWRIDYVFVNESFFPNVKESFILTDVMGSDHCPVGISI